MIFIFNMAALALVAGKAMRLAQEGRPAAGYLYLTEKLQVARTAAACGKPWADRLVVLYEQAEREYIELYGVRLN